MNKKIFIGGTGRSGTTILSRYLNSHQDICKIPVESRFIVDKGGMIDLFYSLSRNYSIDQSRIALQNFYDLMIHHVNEPYNSPYLGHNFFKTFGEQLYLTQFNKFFRELHHGKFNGSDYQTKDRVRVVHFIVRKYLKTINRYYSKLNRKFFGTNKNLPFWGWPQEDMFIGKYFPDENHLLKMMGDFINTLFSSLSASRGKTHWCEDTPANILHMDFLSSLFEKSYFLHIVRNPIGVAYSMKKQIWAPSNYQQITEFLSNIYEKLIRMEDYAQRQKFKYMRVRLEDLHFLDTQNKLFSFLDIENTLDGSVEIQKSKVNYYKDLIMDQDLALLQSNLSKYIYYFGYELNA